MPKLVVSTKADIEAGTDKGTTVLGSLLQSDLPPSEKSVRRLTDEATAMFSAGTETVSWALTVITYHLLSHPAMLERLTAEIAQVVDDSKKLPPWATLEKLPYLNSVIYEGLRLSYGLASRTSRIATDEDLVYRGEWKPKGSSTTERVEYIIPRGYAIGLSAVITHHDETLFPNSHAFLPERWLDDNGQHKKQLDRALLSFSKGSRACIGMK
jgi:cytochrome P450